MLQPYTGGCYWGAFAYEFEHPLIRKVVGSNCSYCTKAALHCLCVPLFFMIALRSYCVTSIGGKPISYVPRFCFRFIKGSYDEPSGTKYKVDFCLTCGCMLVRRAPNFFAVDVHAMNGVDMRDFDKHFSDGLSK